MEKRFLSIILAIVMAVTLLPAPIFAESPDTTPEPIDTINAHRDVNDEDVYFLSPKAKENIGLGDLFYWLDEESGVSDSVIVGLPRFSTVLKAVEDPGFSWNVYAWRNVSHYVDVLKSDKSFDSCEHGTLNDGCSEYNCCSGLVSHVKGNPYSFESKKFYNKVTIKLNNNAVIATDKTVSLYDGSSFFQLKNMGNGIYESNQIFIGEYSIYVNDIPVNYSISVNGRTFDESKGYYCDCVENNLVPKDKSEATAFFSGYKYVEELGIYDYCIKVLSDSTVTDSFGKITFAAGGNSYNLNKKSEGVYEGVIVLPLEYKSQNIDIFLNGSKTDAVFQTERENDESYTNNDISLEYYTGKITTTVDDAIKSGLSLEISNSELSYFGVSDENGIVELPIRKLIRDGEELKYTVKVYGVVDNTNTTIELSENKKTINLDYYTLSFFTKDDGKDELFRTQYVRKNSVPNKVANAQGDGCFDFWGKDKTSEDRFDFTSEIVTSSSVYAHFTQPTVDIYDLYIGTDISGNVAPESAEAFRMPGVAISGFKKGDEAIACFNLETENVEKVYFYNTENVIISQSGIELPKEENGGIVTTAKRVSVSFKKNVSMAYAQEYIRSNVVIKPVSGLEASIKLTVSDDILEVEDTSTITQNQCTDNSWVKLESGQDVTLESGKYYIDDNITINGTSPVFDDTEAHPGIKVSGTAFLYIPRGKTLTVNGSNAIETKNENSHYHYFPGAAGILLLEGNVLYVYGEGTLNAIGGNAENGQKGGDATKTFGESAVEAWGGEGGRGGSGAGAGIGTNGAKAYGKTNAGASTNRSHSSHTYGSSQNGGTSGTKGKDGTNVSDNMGTLHIAETITLNATGGAAGAGGAGGKKIGFQSEVHNNKTVLSGIIGGGGGGYGGQKGANVGQGGGSGAQGGSGAVGFLGVYEKYTNESNTPGGKGGEGANNGEGGDPTNGNGRSGGQAGQNGTGGVEAVASTYGPSVTVPNAVKYKVTFEGASGTAEFSYEIGKDTTITSVPDYTSVPVDKQFMGWRVQTYGAVLGVEDTTDYPLTTAESITYQPSSSIVIKQGTYGDIVLVPILVSIPANAARGNMNVSSLGNPNCYTYTLNLTNNGQPADLGTLVFTDSDGNKYNVNSGTDSNCGVYKLIIPTNVAITLVELDGVALKTENLSENITLNNGDNKSVAFSSMEVAITGKEIGDVTINGPYTLTYDEALSTAETSVFACITQNAIDTNDYVIKLDNEIVPETITKASLGTRVYINYATVNVDVKTNVIGLLNLSLQDSTSDIIQLIKIGDKYSTTVFSDAETEYTLFINGNESNSKIIFNQSTIDKSLDYYEINIVSRVNDVVHETNHEINVDGVKAKTSDNTTFTAIALTTSTCTIKSNDVEVANVTPSTTLGTTYIDYYTVSYTTVAGVGGTVPVDNNMYLKNQVATVASLDSMSCDTSGYYVAAWDYDNKSYGEGDAISVTTAVAFKTRLEQDNLIIHYVDYTGEIATVSNLPLTEKIRIIETNNLHTFFKDEAVQYGFKGWVLEDDPNRIIYTPNAETVFTPGGLLEGASTPKHTTFTAVYDIEYLKGITIEAALPDGKGIQGLSKVGDKFIIDYKVTKNDGINKLTLIPQFDDTKFKINSITPVNTTGLGSGSVSSNTVSFESNTLYSATGDTILSIEYEVINKTDGEYEFGFVLNYVADTLSDISFTGRSYAYLNPNEETGNLKPSKEVKITFDGSNIKTRILTDASITIASGQIVPYTGSSVTITHAGLTGDLYFTYSGYEKQDDCVQDKAQFTVKWYDAEEKLLAEAPTKAGVYKVGVSATASDFYGAVAEVKQSFTITPYATTLTNPTTELTYTGSGQTVSFTPTSPDNASDKLSQDDFTVTYYKAGDTGKTNPLSTVTDVGAYIFVAELKSGHENYSYDSSKEYEFAVTPKAVELIWATDDFTYNGTDQKASVTAIYKDVANESHSLVVSVKQNNVETPFQNAGKYTAEAISFDAADTGSSNYTLPAIRSTDYTMKKARVTVMDLAVKDKVYDGTTAGAIFTGAALFKGLFGEDVLTVSGITGEYANPNVSESQRVNLTNGVSNWTLGGASVDNYEFALSSHVDHAFGRITKAVQAAPSAPTISGSAVIITEADRAKDLEYCIGNPSDENSWISVPELDENGAFDLTGLASGDHTIYLRVKESNNYFASPKSEDRRFTLTEFSVAYNANGGKGTIPSQTASAGGSVTVQNGNALSRTGYTFAGWNNKADGTGTSYTAGNTLTQGTTLYAQWTVNTYKVKFNANGASGSMVDQDFTYDAEQALSDNLFVRSEYTFTGWSTSVGGPILYSDEQIVKNLAESGTVNLYANWAQNTFSITANITSPNNDNPVKIKLMRGNAVYAVENNIPMTLEGSLYKGSKIFENIPAGIYNVEATQVVEGDKNVTLTKLIVLATDGAVNIDLPASGVSSKLEVKKDALLTVAGGLDEEAEYNRQGGKDIIVKMTVEKKEEQQLSASADKDEKKTQDAIASIKATAGGISLEFMDIEIEKTTTDYYTNTSSTAMITETEKVLELVFSYEMSGKKDIRIYREHDGIVSEFVELAEKPSDSDSYEDETFYIDKENNMLYVYAQKYSTYAIGYETESSGGGGSSLPNYRITGNNTENGKLTVSRKYAYPGETVTITVSSDENYKIGKISVKDSKGKEITLAKVSDDKYSFVMPASDVTLNVMFAFVSSVADCPRDETCPIEPFTDTENDYWWHDGVHYCVENGLMVGVSKKDFAPLEDTSRSMLATILWRLSGSPKTDYQYTFKDVKANDWYTEAVRWAQENKVFEGYSADEFGPNDAITREQMMTVFCRYYKYRGNTANCDFDLSMFKDANTISDYAVDGVKWSVNNCVIQGDGDYLDPKANCTRAQAACIVQRFCEMFKLLQ